MQGDIVDKTQPRDLESLTELTIKNISSSHPLQASTDDAYDEYDWALLELSDDYFGVNEIRLPAKKDMKHIFISGYQSIMRDNTQLCVVTRRGLLEAYSIAGSTTSINFFGSKVSQRVWSIQLSKPLGE